MNTSQHIATLRQTHRTATTLLPLLTATLTVAGAVIAAMETRAPRTNDEAHVATDELAAEAQTATASMSGRRAAGRVTVRSYIATLVGRLLLVALGIALTLGLVYLATATGRIGQAITLTALILVTLYLTEKAARR